MGPARSTAYEHGIQAAAAHAQATKAHRQPKATMKGAASAKSSDLLLRCFDSPRIPGCRCARVHALRACVAARWHRVRNCGGPVAISIICATPGGSRAGCGAPIRAGMVAPDSEYAEPMTWGSVALFALETEAPNIRYGAGEWKRQCDNATTRPSPTMTAATVGSRSSPKWVAASRIRQGTCGQDRARPKKSSPKTRSI